MPRLPLTVRLTLFFTVFAALVVLGLGGLFMAAADHHFVELDDIKLQDTRQLVSNLLADAASPQDARAQLENALDHAHGLQVWVREASGQTLYQSAAGSTNPSRSMDAGMSEPTRQHPEGFHTLDFDVVPGWDATTRIPVGMVLDTRFHEHFLHELRRTLIGYALVATLLAGLLGWLAAHQGLAPLRAMKKRAAAISAQRLEASMPVAEIPVEMADLAAELNRMLERLQRDFRRLSEFSTDLAHELRTPISNLLTQTQVTLSARRDADTYRDTLASNAEELERLSRMVADMLFLAKTEHGVDLLHRERFAVLPEVRALVEFHEVVAEEHGVGIVVQGEGTIMGDRLMVRRALSNVLANALRHARSGSDVRITIQALDRVCEVTIENAGVGIDMDDPSRLFDRFYSTQPARAHGADGGTGLGLAITRAIVEAHGGSVAVQSTAETVRFVLRFPRPDGASTRHAEAP